jgi:exodeoxyribonuclease VII large subunit
MKPFTERKIYTVTEITRAIKGLLESNFSDVWVQGEVSNFRAPSSGHYYFTLKDEQAQLKAVCFRMRNLYLKFKLEDGLSVLARGRISAYEPRGDYQMIAEYIEPVGLGSLQLAYEQLKARLRKEGLFDTARKRPLPLLPRKIGIVTSPTGAALRDILRILKRRNKALNVVIYPTRVQGEGAAEEIAEGIRHLNQLSDIDVLIVGRGGGSIEDLWAFNEEVVARAIYDSRMPIISAVGHEIDFTIADFVADLRAATPSVAAELVSGAVMDLRQRVDMGTIRLKKVVGHLLADHRARLQLLRRSRGMDRLPAQLREYSQRVDEATYRLNVITQYINRSRSALAIQASKLNALSPLTVLSRGYAVCQKADGTRVTRASQVVVGERVQVALAHGKLQCDVVESQDGA